MNQRSTIYAAVAAGVLLAALIFGLLFRMGAATDGKGGREDLDHLDSLLSARRAPVNHDGASDLPDVDGTDTEGLPFANFAARTLRSMLEGMLADRSAIRDEALLTFNSEEAYRRFLASVGARKLRLLGSSDALRSARVGFDSYQDFVDELGTLDPEDTSAGLNYVVSIPLPPNSGESPGAGAGAVPFGRSALQWLGISGDNAFFGEGVTVAVLDSGVQEHAAFAGKTIREFDMVAATEGGADAAESNNGHGTAVASIIAGSDPRLPGVAPGAELLSYRILDESGVTDSFTLAQAITDAADAGADIINVSLGSSGDSGVVRQAVAHAAEQGALVVAAAGNEGSPLVSYPAAIEGVVAVSASDARGEHLDFSNSGTALESGGLAAPGYGVVAAWPGDQAIDFSGTSASAPYVSGAVAAVMSANPGMSPQSAYDLLLAYSNEAGAPGADPLYGSGNLNVGRVLERQTDGIVDAAVASYHYDPVAANPNSAQVVIENRGTEALHNVKVDVVSDGSPRSYNVPYLPAGQTTVIDTPIDAAAGAAAGALQVSATATVSGGVNGADRNTSNNTLRTAIEFAEGG